MEEKRYYCPMHPEIQRDEPGSCPICGMTLESREEKTVSPFRRRFWVSLWFGAPLLVFEMLSMFSSSLRVLWDEFGWVQLILASGVVWYGGWPLFVRGVRSFRTGKLNMFSLITLGVITAYFYSCIALFFPQIFPEVVRDQAGRVGLFFDAAGGITLLVLLGQVLEEGAYQKTNQALKALMDLSPKKAHKIVDGQERDIPLDEVVEGDLLRVKPGEQIPVDGVITEGESSVQEAMITGEPLAVRKGVGAEVIGGTQNEQGSFVLQAQKVGKETRLARIIALVDKAQRSQPPVQKTVDQVASIFVPIVIGIAVIAFFGWWLFGPSISYGIVSAVSVLMIACPCAMGLATPLSIMVGVGEAARAKVLVRDAESLEKMAKVEELIVDKTGTITEGKPVVEKIEGKWPEEKLLQWAASIETLSEHPLARPIVEKAKEKGIPLLLCDDFSAETGKGVRGKIEGEEIVVGKEEWLTELGMGEMKSEGIALGIGVGKERVGTVVLSDQIKGTSYEAIRQLKKEGITVVMATGDREEVAAKVAKEVGLEQWKSRVTPEGKHELIEEGQKEGKVVAMAGDGINDAPALAKADVGIAMGAGADVALESAKIALIEGDLQGILKARKLSKEVMRNIRQNLVFAFGYNALGVPLAAGLIYPLFGVLLPPMAASVAMTLSSLSVISNALRLRGKGGDF